MVKEYISYNDSIPFNWTKNPDFCFKEDFVLSNNYRTFQNEIYPKRGCSSNELNKNYAVRIGVTNITYYPRLDFFFP